jgi:hypothetical protein
MSCCFSPSLTQLQLEPPLSPCHPDLDSMLRVAIHVKNLPGCKTCVNDATWLADLIGCKLACR